MNHYDDNPRLLKKAADPETVERLKGFAEKRAEAIVRARTGG